MKIRDTRLWVVIIAAAFLVLWCVSVGVTYASPAQEPLPQPAQAVTAPQIQAIGILGWGLVAIGFLGVALTAAFGGRPRRRRRPVRAAFNLRRPRKMSRSVYTPPPRRYRRNVERRF